MGHQREARDPQEEFHFVLIVSLVAVGAMFIITAIAI
jgi:hypothetical protein